MNLREQVKEALVDWPPIWGDGSSVRLATECLYPSNGNVSVVIEGGGIDTFVIHDDRGAIREARLAGFSHHKPEQFVRHIIRSFGLKVSASGQIYSPQVNRQGILATVIVVANAAAIVARNLCGRIANKQRYDVRHEMKVFVESNYHGRYERDVRLVGGSNKKHKFDYMVNVAGGAQLVLDVVIHDPNSINASVVAHLDLKNAKIDNLEQRIVYDDHDQWPSSDLHLLNVGAVAVPFSSAPDVLRRLAA